MRQVHELVGESGNLCLAMKLKEKLDRNGFGVICVLPSKSVHVFDGQLGAAFYRTTVGNIDVMFMPASMDFELHVVETKKDGRYLYSFEGMPHALIPVWDVSHPFQFIQLHNAMFATGSAITDGRATRLTHSFLRPFLHLRPALLSRL